MNVAGASRHSQPCRLDDPRKNDITIELLPAHHAGYAWEESSSELVELLNRGFLPDQMTLVEVPPARDPGSGHDYSSLSSYLLAVIVSRACDVDLLEFANEHLFGPLGIEPSEWTRGWDGYRWGAGELHLRARDMAASGSSTSTTGQSTASRSCPPQGRGLLDPVHPGRLAP